MTDTFVIFYRYRDTRLQGQSWGQWAGTQYRFDNANTAAGCLAELRQAEEAKRRLHPWTEAEYEIVKNPKNGVYMELPTPEGEHKR